VAEPQTVRLVFVQVMVERNIFLYKNIYFILQSTQQFIKYDTFS
jgi:hypothetical protein